LLLQFENGERYYFLEFEMTNTKSANGINQNVVDQKTAWYLSKIENANRNDKIEFEYVPVLYETENGISNSTRFIAEDPTPVFMQNVWCGSIENTFYRTIIHGRQLKKIKFKLGEVTLDVDGSSRQDLYQDPGTIVTPRINSMIVHNNANTQIKSVNFNYSYFLSNNVTGFKDRRLKLDNIAINDFGPNLISEAEVYKFTYYSTENLPNTSSYAQDEWGYYNGKNNNQSLLPKNGTYTGNPFADREVDIAFAKAGVLEKIEHPTGGSTEYEYESNKIGQGDAYVLSYVNTSLNFNYLSTPINACQSVLLQNAISNSINITSNATVTFHASLAPCGNPVNDWALIVPHGATRVKLINDNTNSIAATIYLNDFNILSKTVTLNNIPSGSYHLEAFVKWSNFNINAELDIATPQYTLSNNTDLTVGGLRIKKITKKDVFNTTNDIITHYSYNDPINPNHSSGKIFSLPNYKELIKLYAFDYNGVLWPNMAPVTTSDLCGSSNLAVFMPPCQQGYFNCGGNIPPDKCANVVDHGAYNYFSNSLNNLNTGNHITYSCVMEIYGNYQNNGRAENYFSNFESFPQHSYIGFDPSWRRGLLQKRRIFDSQNNLKHETQNVYSQQVLFNGNVAYFTGLSVSYMGKTDCFSNLLSPNNYAVPTEYSFNQKEFRFPLEWVELQATYENSYEPNISKAVNYFYDNAHKHLFPIKIVTSDSKGSLLTVYNSYPNDYTISGGALSNKTKAIKDMKIKNMLNIPVESYSELNNALGTKVIDAEYNQFITKAIGNLEFTLLESKYALDIINPLPSFSPISKSITNDYSIDNVLKKTINVNKHNTNGSIIETENRNQKKVSYIWDHENEYVTCKVNNAQESTIAYSSFETENLGNWIYNLNSVITASIAFGRVPTGKNLYNFTQGPNAQNPYNNYENITWSNYTNAVNNNMKTYVVSFWFYVDPNDPNAHVNVVYNNNDNKVFANGTFTGSNIKIVSDYSIGIKGFRYCELQVDLMNVNQALPDNFIIKGINAYIDELRLYPIEARMETATYTPLVGVDDKCNENNKIIYYNYDPTNRLKIIRDQFGNVIQKNEYGIQSID
jgi:hypothetical protein